MAFLSQEHLDALQRLAAQAEPITADSIDTPVPLRDGRFLRMFRSGLRPLVFDPKTDQFSFICIGGEC